MATMIKRIKQFRYSQVNSVQSEQCRKHRNNNYKNKNINHDFKKFNDKILDNTENLSYKEYFNKYCVRRLGGKKKGEVAEELKEKEFYLDKLYLGKNGGKATTVVESMVISLNKRIPATKEAIEKFKNDPDNQKLINDIVEYLTKESRLKDCRFLNIDVHYDEVFQPWEKKPTELFPEGEVYRGEPMVSVHIHGSYIPTVKERIVFEGKEIEFEALNRGEIWKSKTKNYRQSYSQFNDEIFEAVEKKYGYERGELYEESKEDRQDDTIQDWKIKHEREMEELYKEQQEKKKAIEQKKTVELDDELERVEIDKQAKIDSAKKRADEEVEVIREEINSDMNRKIEKILIEMNDEEKALKKQKQKQMQELREQSKEEVNQLKQIHEEEINELKKQLETEKNELANQLDDFLNQQEQYDDIDKSYADYMKNNINTDLNNLTVDDYLHVLEENKKMYNFVYQMKQFINVIFKELEEHLSIFRPFERLSIKDQINAFIEQVKQVKNIFKAGLDSRGLDRDRQPIKKHNYNIDTVPNYDEHERER